MYRVQRFIVLPVLALLLATSCSNDDLSSHTNFESSWCVVQGRGNQIVLETDDQVTLNPSESLDSTRFKAGDRYRVFYIPLGNPGYYLSSSIGILVKISNLQPVFVEDLIQSASSTTSINDLIWLNEHPFFGGGFLNFDFQFRTSDAGIKHGIHLMQDSLVNRKVYVRFGHQANGDVAGVKNSALASFPISGLPQMSLADSMIIRVLEAEDTFKTYKLALRDTL